MTFKGHEKVAFFKKPFMLPNWDIFFFKFIVFLSWKLTWNIFSDFQTLEFFYKRSRFHHLLFGGSILDNTSVEHFLFSTKIEIDRDINPHKLPPFLEMHQGGSQKKFFFWTLLHGFVFLKVFEGRAQEISLPTDLQNVIYCQNQIFFQGYLTTWQIDYFSTIVFQFFFSKLCILWKYFLHPHQCKNRWIFNIGNRNLRFMTSRSYF